MIFNILNTEAYDLTTKLFLLIALPIVIVVSLSIHEYAHGLVSYGLGDPTAKNVGRLTLNPIKHLNPIGTLCMLLFGFGWAKPVPVDPRYYKKPKTGMALCGLAGPAINLIIGVRAYIWYNVAVWLAVNPAVLNSIPLIHFIPETVFVTAYLFITQLLFIVGYYNVILAVFNLIPIVPLDGLRLLYAFLPDKYYFGLMKHERVIMFVMLALLWIGIFDFFIDTVSTLIAEGIEIIVFGILDAILKVL